MVKECTHTGITASLEDYLEAIFLLAREHRVARSRDIAERLSVSKSSVTGALKQLNADGFINYDPYSFVTLTESGEEIAQNVLRRHHVLHDFLYQVLGLNENDADHFACLIEHTIDDNVRERFEKFMQFVGGDKPDLSAWLNRMNRQRKG